MGQGRQGAIDRAAHFGGCRAARGRREPGAFAGIRSEDGSAWPTLFAERVTNESAGGTRRTLARFFFPAAGGAMLEDPATGSATANFGGWCLAMGWPLPLRVEIAQGERVARPSTLYLEVERGARSAWAATCVADRQRASDPA